MTIRWEIKEESCFCVEKMGRDLAVFWKFGTYPFVTRCIWESMNQYIGGIWFNSAFLLLGGCWRLLLKECQTCQSKEEKKNRLSPWIKWYKLNMNWIWNWNWNQNDKNVVDDDWNQKKFFFIWVFFWKNNFIWLRKKKEFGNK